MRPNASRNELLGWEGDRLVVRIQAPQREGLANERLRRFLAAYLEVPLDSVSVVAGHGTNPKIVEILKNRPLPVPIPFGQSQARYPTCSLVTPRRIPNLKACPVFQTVAFFSMIV